MGCGLGRIILMDPKCHKCGTAKHYHGQQDNGKQLYYCPNKECPVVTFNEDYGTGYYNRKLGKKDVDEIIYLFFHAFLFLICLSSKELQSSA